MTLSLPRRPFAAPLKCALTAALLVAPTSWAVAQATSGGQSGVFPAGSLRGEAAIAQLGDDLATVAADNDLTTAELTDLLRSDDSIWVSGAGQVYFVDSHVSEHDPHEPPTVEMTIDPSDAFTLHSRPGANKTIYLDFTGHHSVNNSWGHNIMFPAYNTAGSSTTFTNGELSEIITWWQYVSEDFEPFDVNVTTEEPPLSALRKTSGGDQTWGVRCIMTQPTSGFGDGIGGVAFLNSFNDSIDNPVFVFNKGNNNGSMSASHEVGHAFGLVHDGLNSLSYHPGTGSGVTSWGPIMGAPFGSSLVQWSPGDYAGATSSQNDVNLITSASHGVNFMPDVVGDDESSLAVVGPMTGCPVPAPGSATGVIEDRNDVDAFAFTTSAGTVTISAEPIAVGNLDLEIELLDSNGVSLATDNDPNLVDATITYDVPSAGTYFIVVDGVGKSGSYSDYGSLGAYTVYATLADTQTFTNLGGSIAAGSGITPFLQVAGVPCAGDTVDLNLLNAPPNKSAWLIMGFSELSAPFKGGVLVPALQILLPLNTGFIGFVFLPLAWPAGFPPGTEMFVQYWIQDPAAAFGFAATDGMRIYAP